MWTSDYKISFSSAVIIRRRELGSTHVFRESADLSQASVDLAAESRSRLALAHDVPVDVLRRKIGADTVADLETFD